MLWAIGLISGLTLGGIQPEAAETISEQCQEAVPASEWEDGRTVERISYGTFHFAGPRDRYCYPTQQCWGEADLIGSNCRPMDIYELTTLFRDHPGRFHDASEAMMDDIAVTLPEGVRWLVECTPHAWHDYHNERYLADRRRRECLLLPVDQIEAFDAAVAASAEAAGYQRVPYDPDPQFRFDVPIAAVYYRDCHRFGWYMPRMTSLGFAIPIGPEGESGLIHLDDEVIEEVDAFLFAGVIKSPNGQPVDMQTGEALNPDSRLPLSEDPITPEQCAAWIHEYPTPRAR